MNLYGYWQFTDTLGLSCGIEKYDLVHAFKVKDEMVHAIKENGRVISFHKTNITKNYFERPSYEYHKKCDLDLPDCPKCQMNKFRKTVKRFKGKKR